MFEKAKTGIALAVAALPTVADGAHAVTPPHPREAPSLVEPARDILALLSMEAKIALLSLPHAIRNSPYAKSAIEQMHAHGLLSGAAITKESFFPHIVAREDFGDVLSSAFNTYPENTVGVLSLLKTLNAHPAMYRAYVALLPHLATYSELRVFFQEHAHATFEDPAYVNALHEYIDECSKQNAPSFDRHEFHTRYLEKKFSIPRAQLTSIETPRLLLQQLTADDPAKELVRDIERSVYGRQIEVMNRNESFATRLRAIEHVSPETLFYLLVRQGNDALPSTKSLIIDGYTHKGSERSFTLLAKIHDTYGSAGAFFEALHPRSEDIATFIEQLVGVGKLHAFFDTFADRDSKMHFVYTNMLKLDTAQKDEQKSRVASIVELLRSEPWDGATRDILEYIESESDRLSSEATPQARAATLWYHLIAADAARTLSVDDFPWAHALLAQYDDALPTFEHIPEEMLFPNGVHLRLSSFYNDRTDGRRDSDGHDSLKNTVAFFGGELRYDKNGVIESVRGGAHGWQISLETIGKWQYVAMRKTYTDTRTGTQRTLLHIMNSPNMSAQEVHDFSAYIATQYAVVNGGEPHGIQSMAQRGHVTWGPQWLRMFAHIQKALAEKDKKVLLVDMGGCSAHTYQSIIQDIQPGTFFKGTVGTGVGAINTQSQYIEFEHMLKHGTYDSRDIYQATEKVFRSNERLYDLFKKYRYAHTAEIARIYSAHTTLTRAEAKK